MKNKFLSLIIALTAAAFVAGCDKPDEPTAAPKPPKVKAPAPAAPAAHAPPAESATPAAEVPPTTPEPPSSVQSVNKDEMPPDQVPLEGKGRKLTADEMSLMSYGLDQFKEQYKRYPKDLNEAVKTGFIRKLPQLPAGEKFEYDSKTSQIRVVKEK